MEITAGQMAQKRLQILSKGVSAVAQTIDAKFRSVYGEPVFRTRADGSFVLGKDGYPKYSKDSPYRVAMVTLTYRRDGMWEAAQIVELLKHYREYFRRHAKEQAIPECHYVWVMEMTEIGRPHYHIVMWMPKGVKPPMPDRQGWWPHGSTQAKYTHSPIGYLAKYTSKHATKSGRHLPKGARLWGHGGLKMVERGPVAFALAPKWLKKLRHVHDDSHPVRRVYERVERIIKFTCGVYQHVHEKVIRKTGWFLTQGDWAGYWHFSPYEFEGLTGNGVALRHLGFIEVLDTSEDSTFIHVGV